MSLRKGYFDSEFIKSQLGIALGRHQAFWDIDYDSGERYRFDLSPSKVRRFVMNTYKIRCRFKEGDEYESKDLAELKPPAFRCYRMV